MMLKSRKIIVALVFVLASVAAYSTAPRAAAPSQGAAQKDNIAERFLGERLVYTMGFWWFTDVAVADLVFEKGNDGEYVATLRANTTSSLVDWVLRRRRDVYVSRMALSPDGRRFITRSFEKSVVTTAGVRGSTTIIDYGKGAVVTRSWKTGHEDRLQSLPLPKDVFCDDPLAAFYNFRSGAYGPMEKGREYTIYTFPKEDHVPKIYLKIASDNDGDIDGKISQELKDRAEYVANVKIDKDLFGSRAGDIVLVFNERLVPTEAVAKEIVVIGDVRGRLKSATGDGKAVRQSR